MGTSDNRFTGPLPPELGNLTLLEHISFSHALINGTIPTQIGRLSDLAILDLEGTLLRGTVPTEFGLLQSLTELQVRRTLLSRELRGQRSPVLFCAMIEIASLCALPGTLRAASLRVLYRLS